MTEEIIVAGRSIIFLLECGFAELIYIYVLEIICIKAISIELEVIITSSLMKYNFSQQPKVENGLAMCIEWEVIRLMVLCK